MAMSVKVGDFVSVTMTKDAMTDDNAYLGNMDLNMISRVFTTGGDNFVTEVDKDCCASWMEPHFVDVLEPTKLRDTEMRGFSHLLCTESHDNDYFVEGNYYEIETDPSHGLFIRDDDDGTRWWNGEHLRSGMFVGVTQEQYNATHGIVAPEVKSAEIIPFPTPTRTKFGDMTDAERGALLLAHHEGRPIQVWQTGDGNGAIHTWLTYGEGKLSGRDCEFQAFVSYRIKPQELIDAENALGDAKNAHLDNVIELDTARAELKALEEKASMSGETVSGLETRIAELKAA